MPSVADFAQALNRTPSTARRQLRSGHVTGARKGERGRWEVPASALHFAYARRADVYWQRGESIPEGVHGPDPSPRGYYRFRYQFSYLVELTFPDKSTDRKFDYSYYIVTEPGERKPTYAQLRKRLIEQLRRRYITDPEKYDPEHVVKVKLLESHVVRIFRKR